MKYRIIYGRGKYRKYHIQRRVLGIWWLVSEWNGDHFVDLSFETEKAAKGYLSFMKKEVNRKKKNKRPVRVVHKEEF